MATKCRSYQTPISQRATLETPSHGEMVPMSKTELRSSTPMWWKLTLKKSAVSWTKATSVHVAGWRMSSCHVSMVRGLPCRACDGQWLMLSWMSFSIEMRESSSSRMEVVRCSTPSALEWSLTILRSWTPSASVSSTRPSM